MTADELSTRDALWRMTTGGDVALERGKEPGLLQPRPFTKIISSLGRTPRLLRISHLALLPTRIPTVSQ